MIRQPTIAKQPPSQTQARANPSQRTEKASPEVSALITDKERRTYYEKGRFLGKGGFAHCYELTNRTTREVVAGKVVPKTMLVKQYQRDKMTQEVQIHRELSHKNIVKLIHFFEDSLNVYITLELCSRRSLMELHKRRKALTEPEARYFTHQVVEGVLYLHDLKIIHRDLKLGNLFLNDDLVVKIGDFGLATTVDGDERKTTLCGTPNYIAPEVLNKMGHSFEVDIWAVGCILYVLLFGQPPFGSKTIEEVYSRIRHNSYTIPSVASQPAAALIRKMLDPEPTRRPTARQVHRDIFFRSGFMPTRLPVSCLTMVPKFAGHETSTMEENVAPNGVDTRAQRPLNGRAGLAPLPQHMMSNNVELKRAQQQAAEATFREPQDAYLSQLFHQLAALLEKPIPGLEEEEAALETYQSPECLPIFWISKWADYSDKFGIGYQLCDDSFGIVFNDHSRILLDTAGEELTYIEQSNKEHYFSMHNGDIPQRFEKKVTILKEFQIYMNENLAKAGEGAEQRVGDELARLPILRAWFKTQSAIVFHLSNGTVQINFFDHVKMIMCPLMQAVSFIDQNKRMPTYKFETLRRKGCPEKFLHRLKYAKDMIERLISGAVSHNPSRMARSASAGSRGPLHSGGQLRQSASGSNIQPRR
ncbi:unnamed protein product [Caenorhabditis nigoni]